MTMPDRAGFPLAPVFPPSARVDAGGHLVIADCDVSSLAAEYGTPLYLFDEQAIRAACRAYLEEFGRRLPAIRVLYAAKAYLAPALAALLADEGMGMDVVSGGELAVARAGGFPAERMAFHGNNKGRVELQEAMAAGIGLIVLDNFDELQALDAIAQAQGRRQAVMLRVTPGVDAHTHEKTTTGLVDSKFGFPLQSGAAEQAVALALAAPGLDLAGFHMHLGSPIYGMEPYTLGIGVLAQFAAGIRERHGFTWRAFSPGGGFAVGYTADRLPPSIAEYAQAIADALRAACGLEGLPLPEVHVEPGRSIVARAGVAVYTVGSRKEVAGVRTYVSVDGGMADNVRPSMYGAVYEAVVANRMRAPADERVTIAGKFCETGDLLIKDAMLPRLTPGDLLAVGASGAYTLSMESNYNLAQRPAVVFLRDGHARLVRRRQTYADLMALDVWPEPPS